MVANPCITRFGGGHAALFALVEAQHLPREDHSRYLLLKRIYTLKLSRQDDAWTIDRMRMVWFTDDPTGLFPASP